MVAHNLCAAMRDDDVLDAFVTAPSELCSDDRMPNQRIATFANQRPGFTRAIAEIKVNLVQCGMVVIDVNDIGEVKTL